MHIFEISPSSINARTRHVLSVTMVSKVTRTIVLTNWPGLTFVLRTMLCLEHGVRLLLPDVPSQPDAA
jgi:hypothetical protein